MVVGHESGVVTELASEQTAGQGNARKNPNLLLLGLREEEFSGTLPEAVKDDLNGLDIRELDSFESFLNFLDTNAVVADFARFHEIIEDAENFGTIIKLR